MTTMQQTDVAIIGAGPIGIELAIELKRAGIDYLHFDKGQIAQTISWFPRLMHFFSSTDRIAIAGVPIQTIDQSKCTREEYLAYLRSLVLAFDLKIRTYETVTRIGRDAKGFSLHTMTAAGQHQIAANYICLVTGDMDHPRRLDIPGEDLPHVSHYFDEPHRYFRRRLLVVGGKNSAAESALRCYHAAAHVTISYRNDQFDPSSIKYWLLPELHGRIERGEIACFFNTTPTAISPTHVTLHHVDDGNDVELPADDVLLLTGYVADMTLFETLGVELVGEGRTPVFDDKTMQTNVEGVYVAGTAAAGSQIGYRLFIENCHIHTKRIVAALTGAAAPADPPPLYAPES